MSAVTHYCSCIDHRYASRELALYESMRRHCQPFCLWILCLNEESHAVLSSLALPNVVLVPVKDLEKDDRELLSTKSSRSEFEYFLTCRATFMTWLFDSRPEIDVLTYLDGDLFFFRSPRSLFEQFTNYSSLITPHHGMPENDRGIYNDGWVTFRRDADGLACLRWWRQSCIEWCYDRVEKERWVEQKYLNQFPKKFARVGILNNPGVNLGPWSLNRCRISTGPDGGPLVDGMPVICFHFSKLRRVAPFVWGTNHHHYGAPMSREMRRLLYAPYLAELAGTERIVQRTLSARPRPYTFDAVKRMRFWAELREILKLLIRGGGVWILGGRVL